MQEGADQSDSLPGIKLSFKTQKSLAASYHTPVRTQIECSVTTQLSEDANSQKQKNATGLILQLTKAKSAQPKKLTL